jgi:DNA-binding phage protein
MSQRQPRRVSRPLTEAEQERLAQHRATIAAELPDLVARDQLRKEAREEPTLSAELRRAIHTSEKSLSTIAAQAGMSAVHLDEFLAGERTLRSDVMDRLVQALGYELKMTAATTS